MEPATMALITLLAFGSLKLTAGGTLAYLYGEDALKWLGFARIAHATGEGEDASGDAGGSATAAGVEEAKKEA